MNQTGSSTLDSGQCNTPHGIPLQEHEHNRHRKGRGHGTRHQSRPSWYCHGCRAGTVPDCNVKRYLRSRKINGPTRKDQVRTRLSRRTRLMKGWALGRTWTLAKVGAGLTTSVKPLAGCYAVHPDWTVARAWLGPRPAKLTQGAAINMGCKPLWPCVRIDVVG